MHATRPYWLRLIVAVAVTIAVTAVLLAIPPRRRPPVEASDGIFDSRSVPYTYFDKALGWQDYVYTARPVYQSRLDFKSVWRAGADGCYVLTPRAEWAARPDLRDQVVDVMSRFEERTYSYDPDTLADLPTFSPTCEAGQQSLLIEMEDLDDEYLGLADAYGASIVLAKDGSSDDPLAIHWCSPAGSDDMDCYEIGTTLMHELGHILGLAHSAPGPGPGVDLTIMSIAASLDPRHNNPQFGQCDMAGLQARYGLAGPDSDLSLCLPPIGTKVVLSRDGDRLAATVAIDPWTLAAASTEVVWYDHNDDPVKGHWETTGFRDQLVHRSAAVELWRHDDGADPQDTLVGVMTYTPSPDPRWVIDAPPGGGTFFARFVGDGALLADDSDPLPAQ
jgi:hypothetical protein